MDYYYLSWNIFLLVGKNGRRKSWSKNPLIAVQETLLELVPVDRDKQTETCVWLVFAIRSLTSVALNTKKDELNEGEYILMEALLEILIKAGYINKDINMELEKLRLSVVIEGLSIHALLRPDIFTIEKTEQIITHHLKEHCNQ